VRTEPIGMIYDRALTRELLDVGLQVASRPPGELTPTRSLSKSLLDRVSAQEATGKTKKCLSRIWVAPPLSATTMIRWAVEHQDLDPTRVLLHLGAMIATFPFVGAVCSVIGRSLRLNGEVHPRRVREEVRKQLGDRSTIDVGARKVTTTLRYLGLLEGPPSGPLVVPTRPAAPSELTGWLAHAVLLTRGVELATVTVKPAGARDYRLLEIHTENGRNVMTVRSTPKQGDFALF
jgi:hypothetical protein